MANIFATLYGEAQTAMKAASLYGSTAVDEASDADVIEAYMQYAEAAIGMEREGYLYAESANDLMEQKGLSLLGAVFYAEADGGFFKKIVNGLIKLYEKAKEFIIKLLGRFRSNKQYRTDLVYIHEVLNSARSRNYTEGASITWKKIKYAAIANFITGTLGEGALLSKEFDADGTSVDDILKGMQTAVRDSKTQKTDTVIDSNLAGLKALQSAGFSGPDAYTRVLYAKAIGDAETGGVDFTINSALKPAEGIAKLWTADDKKYTGSEIATLAGEIEDAIKEITFDKISKAIDEGVGQYKDKLDELKSLLSEAENIAKSMQGMNSDNTERNDTFASKMVGVSTQFSGVVANISTAVITAYNTGKVQLDKFIAVLKPFCSRLDELKKSSNAGGGGGGEPKETPAEPEDTSKNKKNKK